MVIATWGMSRIGGYQQVGSGEKGALKSMVASRPQRVRQEYGRFVQCCGRQKAHNASNGVGDDFPLETKCGLLSRLSTERPVSVSPHYAMIARRVERRDALRSSMGHNALNTPCRAGYQGKCPWILLSPTAKNGMKLSDQISPFSFKMDSPHRLQSQFPHR